jgi:hypothetical protein
MRYEITEDKEVYIYGESEIPIIYQPYKPDGTPWNSWSEAEQWTLNWIYEAENFVPEVSE